MPCERQGSLKTSNRQERGDKEVHREDPNEDDLPKPEVARSVMIAGHLRVAAENNSERGNGIAMAMKGPKQPRCDHTIDSVRDDRMVVRAEGRLDITPTPLQLLANDSEK